MSNDRQNQKSRAPIKQINTQLLDEFILFIQKRLGIVVKRDHQELNKIIHYVCEHHHIAPKDYLEILNHSSDDSPDLIDLISAITIGETYFFRDKNQMDVLQKIVLPRLIEQKREYNEKMLRIWSAGSSSGEELYTIIIMLNELLPDIQEWKCDFLGTDINTELLRKAITGRYTDWSMRGMPKEYLDKYFTFDGRYYYLNDNVKLNATFEYINLNSESYPSLLNGTAAQDLILCRNVLIYFDVNHVKDILERLASCLKDAGYLMIGASDPGILSGAALSVSSLNPSLYTCPVIGVHKNDKNRGEITVSRKIESISSNKKNEINDKAQQPIVHQVDRSINLKPVISDLKMKSKWDDIVSLLDKESIAQPLSPNLLTEKATALANLGKIEDALAICQKSLTADPMNAETYYIYAIALTEHKDMEEAERAYRKALFLSPDFLVCRYQFGIFMMRQNKREEGMRLLNNVLKNARLAKASEKIPYASDMQYGQLVMILEQEMQLYQSKNAVG